VAEVALAAGFGSIRRFNETFPLPVPPPRPSAPAAPGRPSGDSPRSHRVTLRLRYGRPMTGPRCLSYLRPPTIAGIGRWWARPTERSVGRWRRPRTVEIPARTRPASQPAVLCASPRARAAGILARCGGCSIRRDIEAIGPPISLAVPFFPAPLVGAAAGASRAGGWNGFELAVRAVPRPAGHRGRGAQLAAGLVTLCARRCRRPDRLHPNLSRSFPSPQR